jgi:lipopolysaccharide assembly protein A
MRVFYFLLLVVMIAALAVFAVQNRDEVTLNYLDRSLKWPMAAVLGAVYVLGMLSGWTLVGMFRRSWQGIRERS